MQNAEKRFTPDGVPPLPHAIFGVIVWHYYSRSLLVQNVEKNVGELKVKRITSTVVVRNNERNFMYTHIYVKSVRNIL